MLSRSHRCINIKLHSISLFDRYNRITNIIRPGVVDESILERWKVWNICGDSIEIKEKVCIKECPNISPN